MTLRNLSSDPPHQPNQVIGGRYMLFEKIGSGGVATVYRARDLRQDRVVALKILGSQHLNNGGSTLARFQVEARTMMEIQHRNVLPVYEVRTEGPDPYIAMEYAEGGSLADWLTVNGPMPPRLAVTAMIQVCKGVAAAHAHGIVHRDIKSHNVLLTRRGVCRVSDFGIAQTDFASLTRTGLALGTLGFMAPEQRQDAKYVGPRADIYSLGATLFHLLTNRMASDLFVANTEPGILKEIPEPLKPILLKACQYHARERHAGGAELARELYLIRDQLPLIPEDSPRLASAVPGSPDDGTDFISLNSESGDPQTEDTGPTMEPRSLIPRPPQGLLTHVPQDGMLLASHDTMGQHTVRTNQVPVEDESAGLRLLLLGMGIGFLAIALVVMWMTLAG